jgi:hypothetical protein
VSRGIAYPAFRLERAGNGGHLKLFCDPILKVAPTGFMPEFSEPSF